MSESNDFRPALKREWLVARIVVIAGLVLAVGVGLYFAIAARERIVAAREKVAAQIAAEHKVQAEMDAAKKNFCPTALAASKALGALLPTTRLAYAEPRATKVKGRYLCVAMTQVALYAMVADFVCPDLKDARCLSVVAVAQLGKNGGMIYKRN